MKIWFYAPLKSPNHPVPSGDRRMARVILAALARAGHEVQALSHLRAYARDPVRAARVKALAARIVPCAIARGREAKPDVVLTYHLYEKAPDWIGPPVAAALGVPYVAVEASVSPARADAYREGHDQVVAALRQAAAVISLNPDDEECVRPHLAAGDRLHRVAPFLDTTTAIPDPKPLHDPPLLVTVAMMRPGDKRESYAVLAAAMRRIAHLPWRLAIVGDGPERASIEADFAPLAGRVQFTGVLDAAGVDQALRTANAYVWPAVGEAYGMALLEAQAAGLPVIAGRSAGVAQIVAEAETGFLVPPRDDAAFAAAIERLIGDHALHARMADAAGERTWHVHGIAAGADALDRVLKSVT